MKSIWIIFLFLPLITGAQVKLNLQKCRKMALENSKKLQSAEQQELKAGYEKKSYRANFLPKVSATGLYAYVQKKMDFDIKGGYLPVYDINDINQQLPLHSLYLPEGKPVLGSNGMPLFKQYAFMPDINLSLGIENAYTVGLTIEQPLYMGGKIRSAFRMAVLGKELAALNTTYNRTEVITEADEAYWQYLQVKEQVISAEKYRAVITELVKNLEDAYQTGMATQNDVLKAKVRLNEAELLAQKARNGMKLSGMNLCRIIGVDLNSDLTINDTLSSELTPGLLTNPDDISARPEYHMLEKQIELKEKQVALTRADFLPQLGISATYGYGEGITLNGESDGIASFAAVASLKVPLYHWGEGRNKIKARKAEEEISRLKQEEMAQMMQLEAAQARFSVEDAITQVKLTCNSLIQAKENLTVSKNRYAVGMETLANYLEAQAQWQKAWSEWIDAKSALKKSETHYLKATGRLSN